ncbi:MAG TPA: alpha/beta hydrolase-fold protein [Gemmatimonadaceae bacterium]|nr:alpha/beta hydrolase-fold protein [Gemmatimonadaceae bacterium]
MSVRSPDKIPGRKLFLVARYDTGDAPRLPEVRTQYEKATQPKQLEVLEGSAHAQFLFKTDQGPGLEYEILHFLTLSEPVPAHDTFTVTSRALGEPRLVNVHVPRGLGAGVERFPVLYMPDGGLDEDFPHVVNTVDSLAALGSIRPVIVVGVPNTERRRDLTGPTRVATDSAIAKHVGGSPAFRRFLRDELIPAVNARYRTTNERALVGESLAGLFVVETFLTEPSLFQHYIALDPSLWWNAGAFVDSAGTRLTALDSARRTLFLATANVSDITTGTSRLARCSARCN